MFYEKKQESYEEKVTEYTIEELFGEISWTETLVGYEEIYLWGRTHLPLADPHPAANTHTPSPVEPQHGHYSHFKKEPSHLVGKFPHTNTFGKK